MDYKGYKLQTYTPAENKRIQKNFIKQSKVSKRLYQNHLKRKRRNTQFLHLHKQHWNRKLLAIVIVIGIIVAAITGLGATEHYYRDKPSITDPNTVQQKKDTRKKVQPKRKRVVIVKHHHTSTASNQNVVSSQNHIIDHIKKHDNKEKAQLHDDEKSNSNTSHNNQTDQNNSKAKTENKNTPKNKSFQKN